MLGGYFSRGFPPLLVRWKEVRSIIQLLSIEQHGFHDDWPLAVSAALVQPNNQPLRFRAICVSAKVI